MKVCYKLTVYSNKGKPKIEIPRVTSVKVTSYINKPSEIEIALPFYENLEKEHIKLGDKIVWQRGYDDELETIFVGYVKFMSEEQPYVIKAYDKLYYIFRQVYDSGIDSSISVERLIKSLFAGTDLNIDWRITESVNVKQSYSYVSYKKLIDGLLNLYPFDVIYYFEFDGEKETLVFEKDLQDSNTITITDDMILAKSIRLKKQNKRKVKATVYGFNSSEDDSGNVQNIISASYPQDNSVSGEQFGYLSEDQIDYDLVEKEVWGNDITLSKVKQMAKSLYDKEVKLAGLVGGEITLFGIPQVRRGMKVDLWLKQKDKRYNMHIAGVEDLLQNGIRQKVVFRQPKKPLSKEDIERRKKDSLIFMGG